MRNDFSLIINNFQGNFPLLSFLKIGNFWFSGRIKKGISAKFLVLRSTGFSGLRP